MRSIAFIMFLAGAAALKHVPLDPEEAQHYLQKKIDEASAKGVKSVIDEMEAKTEESKTAASTDLLNNAQAALKDIYKQDADALARAVADPESDYLDRAIQKASSDGLPESEIEAAKEEAAKRKDHTTKRELAKERWVKRQDEEKKLNDRKAELRSREGMIDEARRNTEKAAKRARQDADSKQREMMMRKAEEAQRIEDEKLTADEEKKRQNRIKQRAERVADAHLALEDAMNKSDPVVIHDRLRDDDEFHLPISDKERSDAMEKKSQLMHERLQMELEEDDPNRIEWAMDMFGLTGTQMTLAEEHKIEKKRPQMLEHDGEHPHWVDANDTIEVLHNMSVHLEGEDTSDVIDTAFGP